MSNQQNLLDIDPKLQKTITDSIDDTIAAHGQANTALAETPNDLLHRALKIYTGVKPLLLFLTGFRLFPQTWRTGVAVFVQVLDALAAVSPDVTVQFKAGKDL